VSERAQAGQGEAEDPATGPTARIGDEPDPAGIVLEPWIVERMAVSVGHGDGRSSEARSVGWPP
jgi:hypothetical protein